MKHILFVLLALFSLVACSSSTSSSVVTPTTVPQATTAPNPTAASGNNQSLVSTVKAGDWVGSGEENFSISFSVGEGGNAIINGITVTYKATCGARASNVTETLAQTDKVMLQAGVIKFTNANYQITGNAVAADRIEGTLKADGVSLGKLGQCSSSGLTWTASPK